MPQCIQRQSSAPSGLPIAVERQASATQRIAVSVERQSSLPQVFGVGVERQASGVQVLTVDSRVRSHSPVSEAGLQTPQRQFSGPPLIQTLADMQPGTGKR